MRIVDKRKFCFTIFVVIALIFSVYSFCEKHLLKSTAAMAEAEAGTLERKLSLTGFFFYDESVFYAPKSGVFTPSFHNGAKVGVGEKIGELMIVSPDLSSDYEVENVYSEGEGLVSCDFDGYEKVLTKELTAKMTPSSLADLLKNGGDGYTTRQSKVYGSGALYKVIKNSVNLTYGAVFPVDDGAELSLNQEYTVFFGEKSVPVVLTEIRSDEEYTFAVFSFKSNDDFFYGKRCLKGELILSSVKGVAVATASITESQGETGVYTCANGVIRFLPLEVLGKNRDFSIVKGLNEGDFYIKNPKYCKKGKILT